MNECECVIVFIVCIVSHRLLFALSFSALHNNIKITTNDDDKMRYVDESRSVFFSFLFSLFLHDFSLFYSSLEVSIRSVKKKNSKLCCFLSSF